LGGAQPWPGQAGGGGGEGTPAISRREGAVPEGNRGFGPPRKKKRGGTQRMEKKLLGGRFTGGGHGPLGDYIHPWFTA